MTHTTGKKSAEYRAYHHAKERCLNPNHPKYPDYGARGIEFRFTSFEQFLQHIGPRPQGLLLDRINNNGHYELGNVRWTDIVTSSVNRRPRTYTRRHGRFAIM
jgi:hypothetical protein